MLLYLLVATFNLCKVGITRTKKELLYSKAPLKLSFTSNKSIGSLAVTTAPTSRQQKPKQVFLISFPNLKHLHHTKSRGNSMTFTTAA